MKIVRYEGCDSVDVEFQDTYKYIKKNCLYSNFKLGQVKNPYDKNIFGIAYVGDGAYKATVDGKMSVEYTCWWHMLERCYYKKNADLHRAYYLESTVCNNWLNFQLFARWYNTNKYEVTERLHVDKDILYPESKTYSPDTCLLVPQRINMLFLNKPNKRGLPNGISRLKNGYSAKYNCKNLGRFYTLDEAYKSYSLEKENVIKSVAEEYRYIIPDNVYHALNNYKVSIENDKNYIA